MAPGRPKSLRTFTFGSKRTISPGPPSPTFSEATQASAMNFGANGPSKIITRANLKASLQAYEELVNTCATYRSALITMSKATAGFADAIERCSGLKGPKYEAGTRLQAASGLHHLIGNLWHVLSETLDKTFEKPLRQHLDTYKGVVHERSQAYESALREKSKLIRDTEARSMNRKERNLQSFREALAVLQRQVDDLDELKSSHYQEIIEHEEEVWDNVQSKVSVVVRTSMDVFDRITAKASDPIIEPMLQSVPDPFDSYGPPQAEDQIFSILAPLSINMTPSAPSSVTTPLTGSTPEREPIHSQPPSATHKITSWLPGTNGASHSPDTAEWATIPSPSVTPPRSTSPPTSISPSSPPNGPLSRRHSVPVSTRMGDSKLRSVLSVIDEGKARREGEKNIPGPLPLPSVLTNISVARPDPVPDYGWNFTYGHSPYANNNHAASSSDESQLTPRHSVFPTQSSPPPQDSPPLDSFERRQNLSESDDLSTPIAT